MNSKYMHELASYMLKGCILSKSKHLKKHDLKLLNQYSPVPRACSSTAGKDATRR